MLFRKCFTASLKPFTAVFGLILGRGPDHKTHLLSTAVVRSVPASGQTGRRKTERHHSGQQHRNCSFLHFSLPPFLKVSNCFGSYYYSPIITVRQS